MTATLEIPVDGVTCGGCARGSPDGAWSPYPRSTRSTLCLTVTPLGGGDALWLVADQPRLPLTRFSLARAIAGGRDELLLGYVTPHVEEAP